jgi:hypothetical protein
LQDAKEAYEKMIAAKREATRSKRLSKLSKKRDEKPDAKKTDAKKTDAKKADAKKAPVKVNKKDEMLFFGFDVVCLRLPPRLPPLPPRYRWRLMSMWLLN